MNLRHRVTGGFALLCVLFLALVLTQLVVSDRLRAGRAVLIERMDRIREVNHAVLQAMTDAETGVRGFQLTGERGFLAPYESGRQQAFQALDELGDSVEHAELRRLVTAERRAAAQWLHAYGVPIVNAGVVDADSVRVVRGKQMFEQVRQANAAVDAAVGARVRELAAADRSAARLAELLFAGLALLVLTAGLVAALVHRRQVLEPIENVRRTLRRLAGGDLTARGVPAGPAELRAVMATVNDLAAEMDRLLAAEHARTAVVELRQRVAAEMRSERDLAEIGRRIARLIGETLDADAVHGRLAVGRDAGPAVSWPVGAAGLDPELADRLRAAPAGVREADGGLALTLSGDDDCPPSLIFVLRADGPGWRDADHDLLAGLGREIDHGIRQARLGLRQARLIDELRRLDAQKDAFVATVTHELRTPLTSLLGYTEILADGDGGDLTPLQERSITAIRRNAHRLRDTVADLLLLDAARDDLTAHEPVPVDLATLLDGLHGELAAACRAKDLDSVVTVEPAWVRGDGRQLACALRKLAENAIKFTPPDGRFEMRLAQDGTHAVCTVTDTGMGIPAADLSGLFTPFHRGANAMDEAVQGTGLGLAIVRHIVTAHGGTVTVRSELGRGSTFTVTLPAIPAPAAVPAAIPA
jgi:two-component system, OmpR family, phosphate regulon sensor histidine kinase PhoR